MKLRTEARAKKTTITGLAQVNESVVYPHVFQNADREVGGVLVGRMPRNGGLPLVTGAIEALAADEQRATLTFTQDAWSHVHATLDHDFPEGEQIVGWYHSHPGFGIFLSGHDLFIHKNFFGDASQIALVVDPHARTEGVFIWRDGEIEPLFERPTPATWEPVGERPGAPIGDSPADRRTARVAPPQSTRVSPPVACAIGLVLGLLIWQLIRPTDDPEPTRNSNPSGQTERRSEGHRAPAPTDSERRPQERAPQERAPQRPAPESTQPDATPPTPDSTQQQPDLPGGED